jgi:hypothetical protein
MADRVGALTYDCDGDGPSGLTFADSAPAPKAKPGCSTCRGLPALLLICTISAALMQGTGMAAAGDLQEPVPVVVGTVADPALAPHAQRTKMVMEVVRQRVTDRYPGLSRQARDMRYRIVISDALNPGEAGRHDGSARTITLHPSLGADPAMLTYVFAHEIGHAIWHGMPQPDRQAAIAEYAAEVAAGHMQPDDVGEVFATLTARVATGRLVQFMPETQRYIRRRICQ